MGDINLFRIEGSFYLKRVGSKLEVSKDDDCDGYLIEASEKECRRIIESLKGGGKKISVVGGDDFFNRRVLETMRVDYLVSPERGERRDTLKQRDSGMNHVLGRIAREKEIKIIIDFGEIGKLKGKELALRLGRIIQNVKICRKAKCKIKIASFGCKENKVFGEKERRAFGESLGMSSIQSKSCVVFK